jgi:hypothetical protein
METQQMMELLLVRMNASMKEHKQEMTARMDANQADRKADQAMLKAKIETNREKDREDLKEIMEEMNAKMDTNQAKATKQEKMLAEIRARMDINLNEMLEDIKSGQAEMRSTLDEWLMDLKDGRKETAACNEATEAKLDPGLMQSIQEHQKTPKGEATVMPVGEPRKRLAAACRKVYRRAKVEW